MSDIPEEIVREAIAADARFQTVQLGIEVENEVNNSHAVKIILENGMKAAIAALARLAVTDAEDAKEIRRLQNLVERAASMQRWLLETIAEGARVEQALRNEQIEDADEAGN